MRERALQPVIIESELQHLSYRRSKTYLMLITEWTRAPSGSKVFSASSGWVNMSRPWPLQCTKTREGSFKLTFLISYEVIFRHSKTVSIFDSNVCTPAQNTGKACRLIEIRLKILFYSPDLVRIKLSGLSLIKTKLILYIWNKKKTH